MHHEGIPGHVWEGDFSNQLPLIRSILAFNAFSEGWALYAEQLADELGAYDDNPAWRLGYLEDQAFRAARLVVDTGLHHKRWTRQQGVDFFVQRNGDNAEDVERSRPLLLVAGPGVRLQDRPHRDRPPAHPRSRRARAALRLAGVRRCRGQGRQLAARRARRERRPLHRRRRG
jgi:hypothetical protein